MKAILVGRIKEHVELQSANLRTYNQLRAEVMKYATNKRLDKDVFQYTGDKGRMLHNVNPQAEDMTGKEEREESEITEKKKERRRNGRLRKRKDTCSN